MKAETPKTLPLVVSEALRAEIAGRIAGIHARTDAALARRGPGPEVQLIAVGKRHSRLRSKKAQR